MMMLRPQNTPDRPLVSFIITTFNTEPTMLRSCIDSIRSLSFGSERREIIVIDDGSDRPAINELLDISDDIIYLRQRNQGISVARNRGTDMASGRYIHGDHRDLHSFPTDALPISCFARHTSIVWTWHAGFSQTWLALLSRIGCAPPCRKT